MMSGRSLGNWLITWPEEYYGVWCVRVRSRGLDNKEAINSDFSSIFGHKKNSLNTRKGELQWTLDRSLKHFHASGTKIWERNCTDWNAKLCYKQVDKPIFVPPKPTGHMPSVLSDAYRLDYIQHESITNKGTWILVQNTRSPNYRTCYAFQLLGISYSTSNWRRFNKQNTSIWLKTQTKIVTTHKSPAGYG